MAIHLYFRQRQITLISRRGSIEAHPGKVGVGMGMGMGIVMELGLEGRVYGTMVRPRVQNDDQLTLNWGIVAIMRQ